MKCASRASPIRPKLSWLLWPPPSLAALPSLSWSQINAPKRSSSRSAGSIARSPASRAIASSILPATEVLPYEDRSPHAEISEDRAVALWRFATGEADLMIAPVQAALVAHARRRILLASSRAPSRATNPFRTQNFIDFLSSAGYDKQITCEMPGQFAVRGGIIDVFSPEAPQPVRVELLGDTIESIRAFDPNTQRSTNPIERATLLPLTEFPRRAEVLERAARSSRLRPRR